MDGKLKVVILGSGTSQGVPVIACDCHVCASNDPKDKRLRSSIMVSFQDKSFVIDSGPDFREQMLREKVKSLDALIFTHEHKDHMAGMDDIRAFNYRSQKPMEVYCSERVETALRRDYYYVFAAERYPGIPQVNMNRIENKPFEVEGVTFTPIEVLHYKMPVFGFRIGDFVYITDAKTIDSKERDKVRGAKILIVNALHRSEHLSHFNLEEALDFIADVAPERAYLTHISHLFGTHKEIEKLLPDNVSVAYDGMKIEI